ncbi:MAG: hypothetical protein A4S09_16755 [Proteobacteria bacterium SG_bin7]|nr:MAG: hypothetical protein A4S09_16755 [Proteobacteria bacterium SG_bin7]
MKSLLWTLIIFPIVGLSDDGPSQTIIKYEIETQTRDGNFASSTPLNSNIDEHRKKIDLIIKSRKTGAMCLRAAKAFAEINQRYFLREGFRVYVTYKQFNYHGRNPASGERLGEKRIQVEILETPSSLRDAKLIENATTVDVADEDSYKTMSGCKRKIEAAFRAASGRLKFGKSRNDNLEVRLRKHR